MTKSIDPFVLRLGVLERLDAPRDLRNQARRELRQLFEAGQLDFKHKLRMLVSSQVPMKLRDAVRREVIELFDLVLTEHGYTLEPIKKYERRRNIDWRRSGDKDPVSVTVSYDGTLSWFLAADDTEPWGSSGQTPESLDEHLITRETRLKQLAKKK